MAVFERVTEVVSASAPADLGLSVLVAGVILYLLIGVLRERSALVRQLPLLTYVVAAAALFRFGGQIPMVARVVLGIAVAAALYVHFRWVEVEENEEDTAARARPETSPGMFLPAIGDPFRPHSRGSGNSCGSTTVARPEVSRGSRPWSLVPALLASCIGAYLIFDDLGEYVGTVLAWESTVVQYGFAQMVRNDATLWDLVQRNIKWEAGTLSAGETSLYYGVPTYALLLWVGANTWYFRLASAIAGLLAIGVSFVFAGRYFSSVAGNAVALTLALSSPLILYSRYGSSNAATLLAVAMAFMATWHFLQPGSGAWRRAVWCFAALSLATLQYATGRLAVLFLLGLIPLGMLLDGRLRTRSHMLGLGVLILLCAAFWTYQDRHGATDAFVSGRGEQVFWMIKNPEMVPALLNSKENPGERGALALLADVVRKTSRELWVLLAPDFRSPSRGAAIRYDPPPMPLYYAPLAVFSVLGIAQAIASWKSWSRIAPVLFSTFLCSVLLLTNRADSHRAFILVLPFAVLVGFGAEEISRAGSRLRVPKSVVAALALVFWATAALCDARLRDSTSLRARSPALVELSEEIEAIPGEVSVWLERDHRELAWLELQSLERNRSDGRPALLRIPQELALGLRGDRSESVRNIAVRRAKTMARTTTLLLGPRKPFRAAAQRLQEAGLRVAERNVPGFGFYRIDGGAALTGISDDQLGALPVIEAPPTPKPVRLSSGPKVYLSDLEPMKSDFGFEPPKMDLTWAGRPIRLGGVAYEKGIGTHAWTSLVFEVPAGARLFQSVVGINSDLRGCDKASVEFAVRDDGGDEVWRSRIIDVATAPEAVEVPVAGWRLIVLETTEAGDGRDCDHASWGAAAFIMEKRAGGGDRSDQSVTRAASHQ